MTYHSHNEVIREELVRTINYGREDQPWVNIDVHTPWRRFSENQVFSDGECIWKLGADVLSMRRRIVLSRIEPVRHLHSVRLNWVWLEGEKAGEMLGTPAFHIDGRDVPDHKLRDLFVRAMLTAALEECNARADRGTP